MRSIAILLLMTALNAGCATGLGFDGLQSGQPVIGAGANPPTTESQDIASRGANPDAGGSTESLKIPAAINRMGRVLKCGAMGAVAGVGLAGLALVWGPSSSPASLLITVPFGIALGVAEGFKDGEGGFC